MGCGMDSPCGEPWRGQGRKEGLFTHPATCHPQAAWGAPLCRENVPGTGTTKVPNLRAVLGQVGDIFSAQNHLSLYKLCIKSNYSPAD